MQKQLYSPRITVSQWTFPQTVSWSRPKSGNSKLVACVVLATTSLDVNNWVHKKISARKVPFASPKDTLRLTGMKLGGGTPRPLCLTDQLPVWLDAAVMTRETIILGGGGRAVEFVLA